LASGLEIALRLVIEHSPENIPQQDFFPAMDQVKPAVSLNPLVIKSCQSTNLWNANICSTNLWNANICSAEKELKQINSKKQQTWN
jgi:hypothetical protein